VTSEDRDNPGLAIHPLGAFRIANGGVALFQKLPCVVRKFIWGEKVAVSAKAVGGKLRGLWRQSVWMLLGPAPRGLENWAKWPALSGSVPGRQRIQLEVIRPRS